MTLFYHKPRPASSRALAIGEIFATVPCAQLEDHPGDIIAKARAMNHVSTTAAASAAGLSETELSALEESGQTAKKINFAAIAPLLGLNAANLEGIANGWLPAPKDLSQWREVRVF